MGILTKLTVRVYGASKVTLIISGHLRYCMFVSGLLRYIFRTNQDLAFSALLFSHDASHPPGASLQRKKPWRNFRLFCLCYVLYSFRYIENKPSATSSLLLVMFLLALLSKEEYARYYVGTIGQICTIYRKRSGIQKNTFTKLALRIGTGNRCAYLAAVVQTVPWKGLIGLNKSIARAITFVIVVVGSVAAVRKHEWEQTDETPLENSTSPSEIVNLLMAGAFIICATQVCLYRKRNFDMAPSPNPTYHQQFLGFPVLRRGYLFHQKSIRQSM